MKIHEYQAHELFHKYGYHPLGAVCETPASFRSIPENGRWQGNKGAGTAGGRGKAGSDLASDSQQVKLL